MAPRKPPFTDEDLRTASFEGPEHAPFRGRVRDADVERTYRKQTWKIAKMVGGGFAAAVALIIAVKQLLDGIGGSP